MKKPQQYNSRKLRPKKGHPDAVVIKNGDFDDVKKIDYGNFTIRKGWIWPTFKRKTGL